MLDNSFTMKILDTQMDLAKQFTLLKGDSMFQKAVDWLSDYEIRVDETLKKFSQELKDHLWLIGLNHCNISLLVIHFNQAFVFSNLNEFLNILLI